ncbi:hypothetical protein [Halorientalis litorea]|uniref:hypothetical protein n=1 Tax=Halorientalis litorea TaxID=2931977 RepID=UPI001FF2595B|nr:hypothetical protein [Halorientalis litorea]
MLFEVGDTPVPVGFAYRPRDLDHANAGVAEFIAEYDAPVGFVVTGDTIDTDRPIVRTHARTIQLPYWLYLLLC